ncbi:hypothetical protein GLOIN_2v1779171 [Rhizophagus irregularis DAOM 181602=DAOM 197198]|uniref:Uncharacterized protein n=1 Tax=Rhizophagus irregularis (strain DAOM 181602 / DAOM 197198 / MUCL 43194) TaxID=747089 RepID=U9UCI3_RHIID|nr:hypothetical protein GLOIN_2v1779171 [Rhizophagus irregularis DAOM 181602=DAOM 197198]
MSEDTKSKANRGLLRLYIVTRLCPYTKCDKRGSGTLYDFKKARYCLLHLTITTDLPLSHKISSLSVQNYYR